MDFNKEKYNRQLLLIGFGEEAQQKLLNSSVLVVGAGGLGVPVLQYLTGMGVGKIGIIDKDLISESNLHRQVLYSVADVGKSKVQVATERLHALNPDVELLPFNDHLRVENALLLISLFDVVVDCTDNFQTRYLINDACVVLNKPFVYGAIHQYEGQISVFNYQASATYRCLFPSAPENGLVADCNANGVLGVLPGIVGCYQANEVVKILTGTGEVLFNKMLVINILDNSHLIFNFQAKKENQNITELKPDDYQSLCSSFILNNITPVELTERLVLEPGIQLVDVREEFELEICKIDRAVHIPLREITLRINELNSEQPVVLICHHGIRSRHAAEDLMSKGFSKVYNLTGGIDRWAREVDDSMQLY
ncbi:thiamine biosynthesis protein ThiF [Solitalea longa]|uniref:Molybdopterin-synthase adenylyltransferase n=1 Tax=Solitalea longa TaxID=2079460 RepID=A0A2S4ZYN5_9SPHI|nr:HesA/MoeB/ThiF family protein [Solitalea longa]POY35461.1 thiamine biosynthesis protein ThiF [Solitalea longa]